MSTNVDRFRADEVSINRYVDELQRGEISAEHAKRELIDQFRASRLDADLAAKSKGKGGDGKSERDSNGGATRKHVTTTTLDRVERVVSTWRWFPYIRAGKLTLLTGDGSSGKTSFAIWASKKLTLGESFPDMVGTSQPQTVLYLTDEEDAGEDLRPRAELAGVDLSRFHVIEGCDYIDEDGNKVQRARLTLADLDVFDELLAEVQPGAVFIDTVVSFWPPSHRMKDAEDVRGVLSPLKALVCEEHGADLYILRHRGKGAQGRAAHSGFGSVDFTNLTRSELCLFMHREWVPGSGMRRTYTGHHSKGNRKEGDSFAYHFDGFDMGGGEHDEHPVFVFDGDTPVTIEGALRMEGVGSGTKQKADELMQTIVEYIRDNDKPSADKIVEHCIDEADAPSKTAVMGAIHEAREPKGKGYIRFHRESARPKKGEKAGHWEITEKGCAWLSGGEGA